MSLLAAGMQVANWQRQATETTTWDMFEGPQVHAVAPCMVIGALGSGRVCLSSNAQSDGARNCLPTSDRALVFVFP